VARRRPASSQRRRACHPGGVPALASVCVFCGSNAGADPAYAAAARSVGAGLAERGIRVVYGGTRVGLMGVLADAARAAGGEVVGVIPRQIWEHEVAHTGLDDLRVVDSMHDRKALMAELADAFITLPGGIGTLEEMFEIFTWAQLGLHRKPLGLLDVNGYFEPLAAFLDRAVAQRFLRPDTRRMLAVDRSFDGLMDRFAMWEPVRRPKWIDLEAT
jgi:uncharacterized protein (TIGR00730 family)